MFYFNFLSFQDTSCFSSYESKPLHGPSKPGVTHAKQARLDLGF